MWILFLVLWQHGDITNTQQLGPFKTEALCETARGSLGAATECNDDDVLDRALIGFCVRLK